MGAITDREICHWPKSCTAYLFLYLFDEGFGLTWVLCKQFSAKSCLSIFTHGHAPTTSKQLIMHVNLMLRKMAKFHPCINYCLFIFRKTMQKKKKKNLTACFYCFVWEVISKSRASCVSSGVPNTRNNKSTRSAASCFHLFLRVWNPWWNDRTRFLYITATCKCAFYLLDSCFENTYKQSYFQSKPFENSSNSCKIIREQSSGTLGDSCAWLYEKKVENFVYSPIRVISKSVGKRVCNVPCAVSG